MSVTLLLWYIYFRLVLLFYSSAIYITLFQFCDAFLLFFLFQVHAYNIMGIQCHNIVLVSFCLSQNWAPPGCEEIKKCLPAPESRRQPCFWPH